MSKVQTAQPVCRAPRFIAVLLILSAMTITSGATSAFASDGCARTICVEQAWTRATPPGVQNAAIYFSIVNNDNIVDTVSSISTPAAAQAMLHQTMISGGVAQMEMVQNLRIPAHSRVVLEPRAYHIMLTGLQSPLKQGMTIPVRLTLTDGRMLEVEVPVLNVAALGPARAASPAPGESTRPHH